MKDFSLFDSTFSLSKMTAYSLSLEIDYNKIIYAIVDNIRKRFVALTHHRFENQLNSKTFLDTIDAYIKKDTYLQKHYKSVDFIYPSPKFMLIPEAYFDKKYIKKIFMADNRLEEGEELQFNYIEGIKSYIIFAIPSDLTNFFIDHFPEISFYHQGIPLLNNYLNLSKKESDTLVALNFRANLMLDIIITHQGKLLFFNSYTCNNSDEGFYYISRVLKDYGYNTQIELLGEIEKDTPMYKRLTEYYPKIRFAQIREDYEFKLGKNLPVHYFVNLFHIV